MASKEAKNRIQEKSAIVGVSAETPYLSAEKT